MPLYQVAPTRQLPHTIDLIQRQSAPRFANEVERDQQYPDPEIGALAVVNTTVEVFNGTGWIAVGGGQPTRINNLQDVDARFPPDGAVLTWSSAAQAWGWSMPATTEPTCITFTDDFERADGPLGAELGARTRRPAPATAPELSTIDVGAAVGPSTPRRSRRRGRHDVMGDADRRRRPVHRGRPSTTGTARSTPARTWRSRSYNFGGGGDLTAPITARTSTFQIDDPASERRSSSAYSVPRRR